MLGPCGGPFLLACPRAANKIKAGQDQDKISALSHPRHGLRGCVRVRQGEAAPGESRLALIHNDRGHSWGNLSSMIKVNEHQEPCCQCQQQSSLVEACLRLTCAHFHSFPSTHTRTQSTSKKGLWDLLLTITTTRATLPISTIAPFKRVPPSASFVLKWRDKRRRSRRRRQYSSSSSSSRRRAS